jgi:hypothetical protein
MVEHEEIAPDGLQQLRAMLSGALRAPMGEKLGFTLVEAEPGHVVFEGRPDRSAYDPFGSVHGGYAATLLDSAGGFAAGRGPEPYDAGAQGVVSARPQRAERHGPRHRPRGLIRPQRGVR